MNDEQHISHMKPLSSSQRKYLRGLAHNLKPVGFVGQKGITDTLVPAIDDALDHHELIKVKFVECKDKAQKLALAEVLEKRTGSQMAGMIGHTAIFYKQNPDPGKRKITVPISNDAM